MVGGLVVAGLTIGLVGSVYLSQQKQDIQQHASAISDVIGYLDNRSAPSKWCSAITGWTCDRSDPSKSITVHFYAPDPYKAGVTHPITATLANNDSGDEAAIAAYCGATTGNKKSYPHRFSLSIPDNLKNNTPIKIYIYGIGLDGVHNPLLTGSGTAVTCTAPEASPADIPTDSPSPSPELGVLAGDINGDGNIDIVDYNILMSCYGKSLVGICKSADLNLDGQVDGVDYNILLRSMGGL